MSLCRLGTVLLLVAALGCGNDPEGPGSGGPVSTTYDITLRFVSTPLPHHNSAVQEAATLWQRVITGDIPSLAVTPSNGGCGTGTQGQNETIDDILIWIRIERIDGPSGVLGQGGPCAVRASTGMPAVGLIILDSADMSHAVMRRVIVHEMGHALGFGTSWTSRGLLSGGGGADPTFSGTQALAQFNVVGGASYSGAKVPVENTGGAGTQDAHWRESVFGNELMTGFISGSGDPLSRVSAASMADLGYTVNLGAAEAFALPLMGVAQPAAPPVALGDDLLRLPVVEIDSHGQVVRRWR